MIQRSSQPDSFSVVYVLTSEGRDVFADMALVSMLSVRVSNPGLRIVAVCDEESAQAIRVAQHRLLHICDELIPVSTPEGEPTFRNRWIKTQLDRFVSGNVLYLDADTLVRGSLADLPRLVSEFGAVANHNGATLVEQHWNEDEAISVGMSWTNNFEVFVNGGVFFFRPCPRVREFYAKWHELWLAGVVANGRLRDQPSLNSAIVYSGVDVMILPSIFNTQLVCAWDRASEAIVWHFYGHYATEGKNSFARMVMGANDMSFDRLHQAVSRALKAQAPWHNQDWFARHLARRVELRGSARPEEQLWLNSRRFGAVRFALSTAWQNLTQCLRESNKGKTK